MNLEKMNARRAVVVTPSNSVDLPMSASALWIGGAGNVNLITSAGDTCLFSGISAGTYLNVQTTRVLVTNTTATLIVALA